MAERIDMRVFSTIKEMRQARRQLGSPAALNEAIVATGIDALFVLLDGGVVEIDGRTVRLEPAEGNEEEGEQVKWLTRSGWTCPYDRDLCGADATLTVTQIDSDQVEGLLECVNGHRWKLARLADLSEGEER